MLCHHYLPTTPADLTTRGTVGANANDRTPKQANNDGGDRDRDRDREADNYKDDEDENGKDTQMPTKDDMGMTKDDRGMTNMETTPT